MPSSSRPRPPAVFLRKLVKAYEVGDEFVPVLKGINLDVQHGEFLSVMGSSGSGKSTLLNMVGLLDTPTQGLVIIDGRRASTLTADERAFLRRDKLGFIFQSFNLMPRQTALQNVMLPLALARVRRADREQRARKLLEAVGIGDRIGHIPAKLSGGQRQRVAIARALALDPPILLADEPTGNLDSKTSKEIMALFRRLHQSGRTIIQVTHELEMARHGSRIVTLADGRIVRDVRKPPSKRDDGNPAAPLPTPPAPAPTPKPAMGRIQAARNSSGVPT